MGRTLRNLSVLWGCESRYLGSYAGWECERDVELAVEVFDEHRDALGVFALLRVVEVLRKGRGREELGLHLALGSDWNVGKKPRRCEVEGVTVPSF